MRCSFSKNKVVIEVMPHSKVTCVKIIFGQKRKKKLNGNKLSAARTHCILTLQKSQHNNVTKTTFSGTMITKCELVALNTKPLFW